MKLKCPKCNAEHEADLSRSYATFLCAACQTLDESERQERRVWLGKKYDAAKRHRGKVET